MRPGGEGRRITLGIRPEHLLPGGADALPVTVDLAEPLGSETVIHGHLPNGAAITARLPGAVAAQQALSLAMDPAALHVFDAETGKRI